jgi:hypothetical protein
VCGTGFKPVEQEAQSAPEPLTCELADEYKSVLSVLESRFEEDERVTLTVGSIGEGALVKTCLLILGEAVRDAYVAAFPSAVELPVHFTDEGFRFIPFSPFARGTSSALSRIS